MYVSFLKIGTKMYKKTKARVKPHNIVKKPLVPDLYESLFAKYSGVRYSTRDMPLKKALALFQKLFLFSF
jgi:hypothetical protein